LLVCPNLSLITASRTTGQNLSRCAILKTGFDVNAMSGQAKLGFTSESARNEPFELLQLESTLGDLPLYYSWVDGHCPAWTVVQQLQAETYQPGVLLQYPDDRIRVLSRQWLMEFMLRPHAPALFWYQPIQEILVYCQVPPLQMSVVTPILSAAQQAFRRPPEFLNEPILVLTDAGPRLLNSQDLNVAAWQIRGIETQIRYERNQMQLLRVDKMASLGRLVDGLAHEILDPVSFIWGNLSFVTSYTKNLLQVVKLYQDYFPEPPEEIHQALETLELDYLEQDLQQAVESIRTGADRLNKLATSLQNFCRIDEVYPKPADLHDCLDHILLLLKSRLTTEVEVIKHYGALPPVPCYIGQLSQVFMNILSNAVSILLGQAVRHQIQVDPYSKLWCAPTSAVPFPRIVITTQVCPVASSASKGSNAKLAAISRWVSIRISDNGPGLSSSALRRIVDSFSVQSRTAKETSLSMSYQIVTSRHGGVFRLRSRTANSPAIAADSAKLHSDQDHLVAQLPPFEPEDFAEITGTEFELLLPLDRNQS